MSKLKTIDNFLKNNDKFYIGKLGEFDDKFYAHQTDSCVNHEVSYCVAPSEGLLDSVSLLQNFMMSLIPSGLEPDRIHDFYQDRSEERIYGGQIYFRENIGQRKIVHTLTSADLDLVKHGFRDGKKVVENTYNIVRRIDIFPFPSKEYLDDKIKEGLFIMTGPIPIHPHNLAKYRRNI